MPGSKPVRNSILLLSLISVTDGAEDEYCQWETFNASCGYDHVIMMTSARYGRMQFGRCMREDHGSVGCSADVLAHVDRFCSGRRVCDFAVSELHGNQPCPNDLTPYLQAAYDCLPG